MITQISSDEHRGTGRVELSPSQLYAIGYGDGLAGRRQSLEFKHSLDYCMGHVRGYRENPNSLYNVEKAVETPLERGWGDELLNPL